jgi:Tfp pilus assembly PilM family ATPase
MVQLSIFHGEILRFNRTVKLAKEIYANLSEVITKEISAEVRRFLEYYQLEYPNGRVEGILFAGEGTRSVNRAVFAEYLAEYLAVPTKWLDALAVVNVKDSMPFHEVEEIRIGYGVAIGLAIRGME